jgi:UDP-glucuronate decarboxylase
MKYLVAGGAGFIGSHLANYLAQASEFNEVYVVDNLSTGNIENLDSKVIFIQGDITEESFVTSMSEENFDVVFNLACPASPVQYQKAPLDTIFANVHGTYLLLSLAYKCKARFFQASTSEVYGDPTVHPQKEDYKGNVNTWGPRACYDEGKRLAETLCYEFLNIGLDVRVARIFNTYGPHMAVDDGRVVSNFIVQSLRGQDLTVYGDGSQTRSFCYVDDLVAGIIDLMRKPENAMHPVNLGNPNEFKMIELAQKVLTLTKSEGKIQYHPLPFDDPKQRKPDIEVAMKFLEWEPKIQLEEGLKETIEYFRSKLNAL